MLQASAHCDTLGVIDYKVKEETAKPGVLQASAHCDTLRVIDCKVKEETAKPGVPQASAHCDTLRVIDCKVKEETAKPGVPQASAHCDTLRGPHNMALCLDGQETRMGSREKPCPLLPKEDLHYAGATLT